MLREILITSSICLIAALVFLYSRYRRWIAQIPVSDCNFLTGTVLGYARAAKEGRLAEWRALKGDFSQTIFPFGLYRFVEIGDPNWADFITVSNNFPKIPFTMQQGCTLKRTLSSMPLNSRNGGAFGGLVVPFLPDPLNIILWAMFVHAFAPTSLRNQHPILEKIIERWFRLLANKAENHEEFDINASITAVTYDFIGETAFGIEFNTVEEPGSEPSRFLHLVNVLSKERFLNLVLPFLKYLPTKRNREYKKNFEEVIALGRKFAEEAGVSNDDSEQRATSIWAAVNSIEDITEYERFGNFYSFIVAGHETSANSMVFTLYELIRHPEILTKVYEEVDSVLQGNQEIPDYSQISQFPYLMKCYKEALRMWPPGGGTFRVINQTKTINGLTLEKGEHVAVSSLMTNNNRKYWPEPSKFNPERWNKEEEQSRPKCAFFTFSQGARECIGKTYAYNEAMTVLPSLLKKYSFQLDPNFKMQMEPGATLKPKEPLRIKLMPRKVNA